MKKSLKVVEEEIQDLTVTKRELEECINDYRGVKFDKCKHCGAPLINGKWVVTI
jgi:hypothetical protein